MADVSEPEDNTFYFKKCLELCQLFGEKKGTFNFSVTIGETFKFIMNHGSKISSENHHKKKKYVSPSTKRRNNLCLLAFKARKAARGNSLTTSGAPPPSTGPSSGDR